MVRKSVEGLLSYLQQRSHENWLATDGGQELYQITKQFCDRFQKLSCLGKSPTILLIEEDPVKFLGVFLAAVATNCPIFLGNPHWQAREWEEVFNLVNPHLVLGNCPSVTPSSFTINNTHLQLSFPSWIMIPTGGSSGKIRFAIHTWETLTASVRGFQQYFQVKEVNSYCVLPLYHVSGLLQFMRSFLTGGKMIISSYKFLKQEEKIEVNIQDFFISLVPTQLQFLLAVNSPWLSEFKTVLLGGGPAWQSLLEKARDSKIRLAPTYGMTETASQVATLKPEDFLNHTNNYHNSGHILPHAKVKILGDRGELLTDQQTGIIAIQANSLFLGYYPEVRDNCSYFKTDDLGFLDEAGFIHILGRNSQQIITGGEKVFPSEVEGAILATQLVKDVAVIGLPDPQWGEVVTAVYVPRNAEISSVMIKQAIADKIARFKQPKSWLAIKLLPRSNSGKIDYRKLRTIALTF